MKNIPLKEAHKSYFMNIITTIKLLFCTIILLGIAESGCKNRDSEHDTKATIAQPSATVASTTTDAFILTKSDLSSSFRIPGELIAYQQVDLYAKVSSYIKKLLVDVGSEVHEGDLLAVLEAPEINSQLSVAASKLKSQEAIYIASKANYDRLSETSKTPGTISRNDLDQANARQQSDLAQLEAAKSAYREVNDTKAYLQIRAPFDGVITNRNVSAGAYVGPTGKGSDQPIFTLQEHRKLRLIVSVPEAYSAYLSHNTEVDFEISSLKGKVFKARLSRLAGVLDSKLRSQHIEMDVLNTEKKLLPGMIAEVLIPLKVSKDAFMVPVSAVLNSTLGIFIIKTQQQHWVWVPVKTGRTFEGKTEVFGPLQSGDTLIAHAAEETRNGGKINSLNIKRTKSE